MAEVQETPEAVAADTTKEAEPTKPVVEEAKPEENGTVENGHTNGHTNGHAETEPAEEAAKEEEPAKEEPAAEEEKPKEEESTEPAAKKRKSVTKKEITKGRRSSSRLVNATTGIQLTKEISSDNLPKGC